MDLDGARTGAAIAMSNVAASDEDLVDLRGVNENGGGTLIEIG